MPLKLPKPNPWPRRLYYTALLFGLYCWLDFLGWVIAAAASG